MDRDQILDKVYLRYHLENNAPVDLMDFTQSLQALQSEYTRFSKLRGAMDPRARLNIQKVEDGSIVFELIEAMPSVLAVAGGVNTLVEFGTYLHRMVTALTTDSSLPEEGNNKESLDNTSKFIQPLASNPQSQLSVDVKGEIHGDVVFNDCIFNIGSNEGNALQNRANAAKEALSEEANRTEEVRTHVLLRVARLDREPESKQDRGIIEAFDPRNAKKLLLDDEVKSWFMQSDENVFKALYYVDATALYQEGRIKAYRITRVYESFVPED